MVLTFTRPVWFHFGRHASRARLFPLIIEVLPAKSQSVSFGAPPPRSPHHGLRGRLRTSLRSRDRLARLYPPGTEVRLSRVSVRVDPVCVPRVFVLKSSQVKSNQSTISTGFLRAECFMTIDLRVQRRVIARLSLSSITASQVPQPTYARTHSDHDRSWTGRWSPTFRTPNAQRTQLLLILCPRCLPRQRLRHGVPRVGLPLRWLLLPLFKCLLL